jgi:predicted nucleic acid-binding protein
LSSAFVVDASVAVKWLIEESDSALAEALAGHSLSAPSLLLIECANVLWRRARIVRALMAAPVRLVPSELHLEQAVVLATERRHPVYDCVYLCLARASATRLVSADRRFVSAVRRQLGFAKSVVLLAETAP